MSAATDALDAAVAAVKEELAALPVIPANPLEDRFDPINGVACRLPKDPFLGLPEIRASDHLSGAPTEADLDAFTMRHNGCVLVFEDIDLPRHLYTWSGCRYRFEGLVRNFNPDPQLGSILMPGNGTHPANYSRYVNRNDCAAPQGLTAVTTALRAAPGRLVHVYSKAGYERQVPTAGGPRIDFNPIAAELHRVVAVTDIGLVLEHAVGAGLDDAWIVSADNTGLDYLGLPNFNPHDIVVDAANARFEAASNAAVIQRGGFLNGEIRIGEAVGKSHANFNGASAGLIDIGEAWTANRAGGEVKGYTRNSLVKIGTAHHVEGAETENEPPVSIGEGTTHSKLDIGTLDAPAFSRPVFLVSINTASECELRIGNLQAQAFTGTAIKVWSPERNEAGDTQTITQGIEITIDGGDIGAARPAVIGEDESWTNRVGLHGSVASSGPGIIMRGLPETKATFTVDIEIV